MPGTLLVKRERIERRVLRVRGHNVMLDGDLATLYRVDVRTLNQAVKRNRDRFPSDFMFRLTAQETKSLRSQIVISKVGRGGRRNAPYAFTEQGVAMLSSVLRSTLAIHVNIEIMRAFVKVRRAIESRGDLVNRLDDLEAKYDEQFAAVFAAIRRLIAPPRATRKRIGFRVQPQQATQ